MKRDLKMKTFAERKKYDLRSFKDISTYQSSFCLLMLLFFSVSSFAQQSKTPPPKLSLSGKKVSFAKKKLDNAFSAYDLYQIDFNKVKQQVKKHDQFEVSLKLGDEHQWNLLLLANDMRGPDFKETVPTEDGFLKMPERRINTFKGYINNPGSLGEPIRFNIDDNFLNGFVTVEGQIYFLEPLAMTQADAPNDFFIVYRPEDVTGDEAHECTYNQAQQYNPYEEGEIEFDHKKHDMGANCFEVELVTACTWDYVTIFGGPGAANAQIAAVTNIVEGMYAPFMLDYILVEQFAPGSAGADPFTPSFVAEDLLTSFRNFAGASMANHDLGQIWVGRNIAGCFFPFPPPPNPTNFGLIGCANCLGCVCEELRYNVCEHFGGATMNCLSVLSAHEFGHNWGGTHVGGGTIMGTPLNCAASTWSAGNTATIQNHIDTRTCLAECCDLVVDCSKLKDETFTCAEDIPEPDESLIVIEESCGEVNIFVVDEGEGTPGNPIERYYFIVDEDGNTRQCMQVFTITGNEVFTSSIWPRTCVLHKFTVKGDYVACSPLTVVSVDVKFYRNGNLVLTVPATVNANGTWEYQGVLGDLDDLGIEYGTWYDVVPCLNLSDGTSLVGEQFIPGQNNDIYFADQSDPQVVVNNSATDATTSLAFVCEGDPLYYHGLDPLSANHFSAIRRKPKTSPGPFTNYQAEEWVGVSLDGYTGDLNAQYPGYFQVGYIYQLYIASYNGNPDVCIAWTPVTVEFEVVDCCQPTAYFDKVPECVKEGKVFPVSVVIEAPLSADDIENIYSGTPNFTYVTHQVVEVDGTLVLTIYFETKTCTCEGEMLIMDIILKGCSEPIWMMTDKLPCCAEDCKFAEVGEWTVGDCVLVNGKPAREFCLYVHSSAPINDILEGTNDITCQTDIINLDIEAIGKETYRICGTMVFEDPACTGHALLTFVLDTEYGCCKLEKAFSFPGGCTFPEPCLGQAPNIEIIRLSNIHVSLGVPIGATVTVTDHITGNTTTETVGTVTCGPFAIDQNGNIFGGTDCPGINLTGPKDLDCRSVEGERPSIPYYFEIRWGKCVWILTGDYCRELIVYPQVPNDGGGKRSANAEALNNSPNGMPLIYPNPTNGSDIINFDVSNLGQTIKNVRITDLQGRMIESFIPNAEQQAFQHRLVTPLTQGVYFVILELADGSLNTTKLIAVE